MDVPLARIVIGTRRREDLGDLQSLMASIARHGLIHPIVVDDEHHLVAGQRRLEACRRLGKEVIEIRTLGSLTEAELRELELEENLHRKDLTQLERDKVLVARGENAAAILRDRDEAALPPSHPTAGWDGGHMPGPRPKPDTTEKVADFLGVSKSTLNNARRHVAAVAGHPELAQEGQTGAIRGAKRQAGKARQPTKAPPSRHPKRPRPEGTPGRNWLRALNLFQRSWEAVGQQAGLTATLGGWPAPDREQLATELLALADALQRTARALYGERSPQHVTRVV